MRLRTSATTWPRALARGAGRCPTAWRTTPLAVHRAASKVALRSAVVKELYQVLEDTGATVRTEVVVPEFAPATTRHLDI